MNARPPPHRLRFGSFELDLDQQQLTKAGRRLRLQPQPWKVLALLVGNAGRLVTREQLQEHLWGDRIVEADKGLNFCVRQIRRVLGERAEAPTFIETVPRRGYRFIATVEIVPVGETAGDPIDAAVATADSRRRWLPVTVGALAAVLLLTVFWTRGEKLFGPKAPARIAVLPFVNAGGGEEGEVIATGLTQELVTELGRLDSARIGLVSLDASRRFVGHPEMMGELRRALGVDLLLRGTVQLEGSSARLRLRLESTADQRVLWTESFDSAADALLTAQQEVGRRAVAAIARSLGVGLRPPGTRAEDPRERQAYLRALYLLEKADPVAAGRSIEFFEQAITADPRSARAYAGLAEAIVATGSRQECETRGREAARRAVALDPDLPSPHLTLAWITATFDWNWPAAEAHLERALAFAPDSARAHAIRAYLLLRRPDRESEGLVETRRAQELDPVSPVARCDLAWAYLYARRFTEAEAQAKVALALEPRDIYAALCRMHSLEALDRTADAASVALELMQGRRASEEAVETVAGAADSAEALQAFRRWWQGWLADQASQGWVYRDAMAAVALGLGYRAEAMRQIHLAVDERASFLIFLAVDLRFDALRGAPEFDHLVQLVESGADSGGEAAMTSAE